MKKYIMIFSSFILALMILLIPSNNVKAEELPTYYFNYSDVQTFLENYSSESSNVIDTYIQFLKSYESDYYVYLYGSFDNNSNGEPISSVIPFSFSSYLVPKTSYFETKLDFRLYNNNQVELLNSSPSNVPLSSKSSYFYSTFYFGKDIDEHLNNLSDLINTGSLTTGYLNAYYKFKVDDNLKSVFSTSSSYVLLYSNFDYIYYNSSYNLNFDGNLIEYGDSIPTYYDVILNNNVVYEHNIELNPNDYNFLYLKFKGIGDLDYFSKHSLTTPKDLFYFLYKNDENIYTPYVSDSTDLLMNDFFTNSTEEDIYTLVVPFYKYEFNPDDVFKFYFTVPGLIEYGTNEYKYTYENDEWISSDSNRSDITDLLVPSENKPDEIVSSTTSHNSLTNDSLNEFMWPYSLFARNGNNIKNISLTGSFSSTSVFSVNDFNTNLIINYGSENYKININNCISLGNCNLTSFEQNLIKNILFDRNVENTDYYLDFSVEPQKNLELSASDQFNFGISINFNSSVELTINSMLLAINDLSNSYYNVYFKLYDSAGQVHTIYKTSLDSEYIGVNQFQLDSRTADIYRVDLMFVYNHTLSSISTSDIYSLKFSEFNIFANTNMIHIYTDNIEVTYQTCSWYDMFCHGQNIFTWFVHEAPFASDFWKIFLYITNIFDMLWVIITYIFMPFDIIPPIFGIPMSTILPFLLVALFLIKKLWLGGDS